MRKIFFGLTLNHLLFALCSVGAPRFTHRRGTAAGENCSDWASRQHVGFDIRGWGSITVQAVN